MEDQKNDSIVEFVLLGFLVVLLGWLAYTHTGNGPNQLSPQLWVGMALPLLAQLFRKQFDLKKPDK